ncbi:class I SAM-dependent methyltransferase [Sedimentitalea sp. JM2-8]|uniref:Class I SAM-dependent methyltransferase n=1 Tax=Sedimentitalea xiamensis TaxID=3050037 RepID=A0ABT7FJF9_9RHOB|nr:class I SAM-dependent methyltransferase [Sedimentitalea xiamensis]MDK3075272.1 class I SAM-dependent methyltransferase [Sedimentitalea xiamensis]
MNIQTDVAPDYTAIKAKQNGAWASGDYAVVGTTLQIVGERLAERLDLVPGASVLDVAAGNGNATLAFARRFHEVTSTDYVQDLLDKGEARARAEATRVSFQIADAEALPFADESFDATVSTFGVMFAPNQQAAARELLRVIRKGGRIGMANWTPAGFVGQLFKTLGGHVAPPAGVKSPALWGDAAWLHETFEAADAVEIKLKTFNFRYRAPEHFIDVFRTLYGPVHKAFLALDDTGRAALEADMLALIDRFNVASDGSVKIPGEYAEVAIRK